MSKCRKVLIVGPVGAGKTTAIRSATDDRCIVTDVKSTDPAHPNKEMTTVAMDFGIVPIPGRETLHIYGAPGQPRFSFMWDILAVGAHGIILLIDNCSDDPKRDLNTFLLAFVPQIAETRFIVGVTRTDLKADPPLEDYAHWLGEYGINAEVACVDPREKEDVMFLLDRVLESTPGHTQEPFVEPEASPEEPDQAAAEVVRLEESAIQAATTLDGVKAVTLTDGLGHIAHTTLQDSDLNGFIALVSSLSQTFEATAGLGLIRSITLCSPIDDGLTILPGSGNRALGFTSDRHEPLPLPWQKLEELNQWSLR